MDATAQVEGISDHPDGKRVTVSVSGPKGLPDATRELRARGRALIAVGVLPASVNSIREVTAGQLKGLTRAVGDGVVGETGRATKTTSHEVVVMTDTADGFFGRE